MERQVVKGQKTKCRHELAVSGWHSIPYRCHRMTTGSSVFKPLFTDKKTEWNLGMFRSQNRMEK